MTASTTNDDDNDKEPATVVIAGAGIVGLVLALALQKHVGITAEVYEKAPAFHDEVGVSVGFKVSIVVFSLLPYNISRSMLRTNHINL